MKIGIILPTWNVSITLLSVLNSIAEVSNLITEILVIDNDSQDETIKVLMKFISNNSDLSQKTTILKHKVNYGYGASIKTGFDYFKNKTLEYVIILHSDNQSDAKNIVLNFINQLKIKNYDVVLGNRFDKKSDLKKYSPVRRLGNYFFNFATWIITSYKMPDAGAAIMIIRAKLLDFLPYQTISNGWQFHPQLNLFLYSNESIQLKEIPLNWKDSDRVSQLNLISYGLKLLKILTLFRFKKSFLKNSNESVFSEDPKIKNKGFDKIYPQ